MPVHVKGPCGRRPCAFWTEPRSIWQLRLPFVKTLHSADEDEVWMVGKRTQKLVPIPGMLQATLRPNKVCCNAAISACDKGRAYGTSRLVASICVGPPAVAVLHGGQWQLALGFFRKLGTWTMHADAVSYGADTQAAPFNSNCSC